MRIELYYAPIACSLVPFITLTEAKANFTVNPINIRQKHQMSESYLKINPKHKVPLLIVDGQSLTENVAIQIWIAGAFPKVGLLPTDPWEKVQAISTMAWCAAGIHPYLSRLNNPAKVSDIREADHSVANAAKASLREAFAIAEDQLGEEPYFFGAFTAIDAYFFWCFRRAKILRLDLGEFEACNAHYVRMMLRESVMEAMNFEKQTLKTFAAPRG